MAKGHDSSREREVNLSKLLDSRALELEHFLNCLKKKDDNITKTPMQRVPKHMRRRAMAHNRYRIPSRIRAISMKKSGVSEDKKLKCRKHLRNTKLLLLHYYKRSLPSSAADEPKSASWLETHFYHARRFHMGEYYSSKIALRSTTKCFRSSFKLAKFKSVLYDLSYYRTVSNNGILEVCHPASELAQNKLIEDGVNVFEVIGPHALLMVQMALENEIQGLDKLIEHAYDPIYFPPSITFKLDCQMSTSKKSIKSPFQASAYDREQDLDKHFEQEFSNFATCGLEEIVAQNDPLNYLDRFKVTSRGRHTHKNTQKNHVPKTVANTKEAEKDKTVEMIQEAPHTPKDSESLTSTQDIKYLLSHLRAEEYKPFSLIIMNMTNPRTSLRRIRIIAPLGKGRKLFERLASRAALVIGKEEYDFLMHQHGMRVFPQDYPGCKAFEQYETQIREDAENLIEKRPHRKRTNYAKLDSVDPFSFNFSQIGDSLTEVQATMLTRSTPCRFAYVCFPTVEDFLTLKQEFAEKNQVLDKIMNTSNSRCLKIGTEGETRDVIGRFTSGGFNYTLKRGAGRAFVSSTALSSLQQITSSFLSLSTNHCKISCGGKVLALVRKPSSQFYHFCVLDY